MTSKWKCPACGSHNVQISLPTWYKETQDGQLEAVEVDSEADVLWWWCEDCDESELGEPNRSQE